MRKGTSKKVPKVFLRNCFGKLLIYNQAKKSVLQKTQGFYSAPLKARIDT